MWNISFEKGRQVWEYLRDREQPVANETKDGRAVRTKEGIAYNGLPLMTDGVVHTHMLKDGAKGPTPLGKRDVTFDPRTVQSVYDSPKPLQEVDISRVIAESRHLSNPNTGDDVFRKQNVPSDLFRPGSSTATTTAGANKGVPTVRSVYKKDLNKIHDWNMSYIKKRRQNPSAPGPENWFEKKFSPEAINERVNTPTPTEFPEEAEVDLNGLDTKDFLRQVEQSAISGAEFFKHIQGKDGHIPSDYGGPMFLMPGCVITCYITGTHLPAQTKLEMIKYICSHQQKDGGWGLHIESKSTMFGTVLNYVSLRLLGVSTQHAPAKNALEWIRKNGGALGIPSWGKFWLAVLNILPWEGMNSIFPEMWLLPQFLPIYPGRFWCHCRMVYLPMAYIYGARFCAPVDPLIEALRSELYVEKYDTIDFTKYRDFVSMTDKYTEQALLLKIANGFMNLYEKLPFKSFFRKKALNFILDYVSAEDEQTNYVDIGPVSKFINMLCTYHGYGRNSMQFRLHQARIVDYMWLAEDGIKLQGYNGSQCWDTSFTVQAFSELEKGIVAYNNKFGEKRTLEEQYAVSPLRPFYENAYKFIEDTQIRDEVIDREKYFRHVSEGGWPFSTRDHGWPISDCTAEGLKAVCVLHSTGLIEAPKEADPECGRVRYVDVKRMQDAIHVMLTLQNYDGGWATYENTRGPAWLEMFNPSEVFGGIMIDYSYVECSSACVQALTKVKPYVPESEFIERSIQHGIEFIQEIQRPDGGWVGSWGVCFTYGAWFGMEGLRCAGFTFANCPAVQKGCAFLLKHQNKDGGWGESFESCVTKEYCYSYNKNLVKNADGEEEGEQEPVSMVINTAWAMLALLEADYHLVDRSVLDRAAQLILSRQLPNGDWPQEGISGVFNGNCMITYTAYRSIFPIWALGRYLTRISESLE